MTNIENAFEFFIERCLVIKLVGLPGNGMPGWRFETALSPFAFTHDGNSKMPGFTPGILFCLVVQRVECFLESIGMRAFRFCQGLKPVRDFCKFFVAC